MNTSVRVRDWRRLQHYRERTPIWIKLYNELLDNYEFAKLPDATKAHLIAIYLLASRCDNNIPDDPDWIATRISATEPVDLDVLISAGFLERFDASKPLAGCYQAASPEKSRVEKKEMLQFEEEVGEVFTLCCELRDLRTGKKGGPALQLTNGRASKIRARLREGFTVDDLKDCTRGFYADTWSGRDNYLDPKYAFKDDDTVRRFIDQHRNGQRNGGGPQYQPRRGFEGVAR